MKNYINEKEGQLDFFKIYSINFENNFDDTVIKDSTDGIFRGSLFEFKLLINDLNKVLFQAIKYLSKERIRGHNVPASIFLVDLNRDIVYEYKSKDYFEDIHKVYTGAASKENFGFIANKPSFTFNLEKLSEKNLFLKHLEENTDYLKINIDDNCIVGWAERYYKENPEATKDDFLKEDGELRKPDKFKDLINPYIGETNVRFKYIMDKLNDKLKKKTLGAFYTPPQYASKAVELVRKAIKAIPEGKKYIIFDRCAGTGNLEAMLTDEELSHCILSTYEYYEWLVLKERLGDKVLKILPEEIDSVDAFDNGYVKNNNALSEGYIQNNPLKEYIENDEYVIIMLENPPYMEVVSNLGADRTTDTNSFVLENMKKDIKGVATNELANRFIWSAFKYFLRKDDFFIILSPVKYWKSTDIVKKEFVEGYIFNRKHFHASPAAVSCILWKNIDSDIDKLENLKILNIDNNGNLIEEGKTTLKKVNKPFSTFYDTRKDQNDIDNDLYCGTEGTERTDLTEKQKCIKGIFNSNIIAYLNATSFISDSKHHYLVRANYFNGHGFHIRKDNYLSKIVLSAAKLFYVNSDWFYLDMFYNTSDGGTKYETDNEFLKYCLIYTSLSQHNKCLSFKGSDGRNYFNELCFDKKSPHKSQALIDFESMTLDNDGNQRPLHKDATDSIIKVNEDGTRELKFAPLTLNAEEVELIKLWDTIMDLASQTKNYKKDYSYGLYQIIQELNTFVKTKDGNQYDYPLLNGNINTLKTKLKEYYKKYIEPKCFEYELLK